MYTDILKAVYAGREHAYHALAAIHETALTYGIEEPIEKMHGNEESGKEVLV